MTALKKQSNPVDYKQKYLHQWKIFFDIDKELKRKHKDVISALKEFNKATKPLGRASATPGNYGDWEKIKKIIIREYKKWYSAPKNKYIVSESFITYYMRLVLVVSIMDYFDKTFNWFLEARAFKNIRRIAKKSEDSYLGPHDIDRHLRNYRSQFIEMDKGKEAIKLLQSLVFSLSDSTRKKLIKLGNLMIEVMGTNFMEHLLSGDIMGLAHEMQYYHNTLQDLRHFEYSMLIAQENNIRDYRRIIVHPNADIHDLMQGLYAIERNVEELTKDNDVEPTKGEVIIDFGDARWEMLPVGQCRNEATLMSHCGNVGGNHNSRILSFRVKVKKKRKTKWVPKLTFIWVPDSDVYFEEVIFLQIGRDEEEDKLFKDWKTSLRAGEKEALAYLKQWHYPGEHEMGGADSPSDWVGKFERDGYVMAWRENDWVSLTYRDPNLEINQQGYLGEMKGFANSKPKKEYWPYIKALLVDPLIVQITGEGYSPQNNFNWCWLSKKDQNKIQKIREQKGLRQLEINQKCYPYNDEE